MTVGDRPRCFPYGCCHSFPLPVPKPDCTPASGPVRFQAVQSARVSVTARYCLGGAPVLFDLPSRHADSTANLGDDAEKQLNTIQIIASNHPYTTVVRI